MRIFLDFESRSEIDITTRGLDNYVRSKTTEPILLGHALDDRAVELWHPQQEEMPRDLREHLLNPSVVKVAWNAPFERGILKYVLGIDVPLSQWLDPSILCRHLSLPGSLEDCSEILKIKAAKLKWGTLASPGEGQKLIKMFCMPMFKGGGETLFGVEPAFYRDWNTNPKEWETFEEYCKADVGGEREILNKLVRFPLPEIEQRGWILDQEINERGVPLDDRLISGGIAIAQQEKEQSLRRMAEITKLENPNSVDQMLAWAQTQGYPFNVLRKEYVTRALAERELTPECREALTLRKQTSRTSVNKLEVMQNIVSPDGRLRHQFWFLGSSRAGRWSGKDAQLHNLPKPTKMVEKNMDRIVDLVRAGDYESIKREFSNPIEAVSGVVRAAIRAPAGYKLVVSDLNAIENRVLGWIANSYAILNVFHKGLDPYLAFAVAMYHQSYKDLLIEYEAGNKEKRNHAKAPVLGAGYGLGGGEEFINSDGDLVRSGLWGYAQTLGVEMSKEQAHEAVRVFRKTYPEVVQLWRDLDYAVVCALNGEPHTVGPLRFSKLGKVLRIELPSGRSLHYLNPRLEMRTLKGRDGEPYEKEGLAYDGRNQVTGKWGRVTSWGGKICENVTQAVARDILLAGLTRANEAGFEIVAHVHDEAVSLMPNSSSLGHHELSKCLSTPPIWAPDLPLGAEGYESQYYRKN